MTKIVQRHDPGQAPAGGSRFFELAAPFQAVARRQLHFAADAALGLGDEAALVAAANVGSYADLAPVVTAGDDAGAVGNLDLSQAR